MSCELTNGAIFLHIPKTGGSWVLTILEEMGLVRRQVGRSPHTAYEHAVLFPGEKRRWKEWRRAENWRPANITHSGRYMKLPYTFCFVRHPVKWYESWWRYLKGMGEITWKVEAINEERRLKRWNTITVPTRAFCPDFNEFVRNMHSQFPGYVTWMYGMYAVPEVNFVGKQEQLADGLIKVFNDLKIPFDESRVRERPHVNKAKLSEETIQWDEGLLREIQAAEQTIMVRYGYPVFSASDRNKRGKAAAVGAA